MIPTPLRTAIVFLLAGWCFLLPVLGQTCPCDAGISVVEESAVGSGPSRAMTKPARVQRACCGRCTAKPVDTDSAPNRSLKTNGPEDCRCDQAAQFHLVPGEVSDPERVVLRLLQPAPTLVAWTAPLPSSGSAWERPLSPPLKHQRKLASLGVWRL